MKIANFAMLGPLKKYKSISALTIAKAMLVLANSQSNKQIIESEEIKKLV
ncbi:hypothetical protein [Mesonia sp. K4-1]